MGVNRTEQTLSSRKATNSRVAPLRGATLGGWLLLRIILQRTHKVFKRPIKIWIFACIWMGYGPLAHFKGPSSFWARIIPENIPRLLYHIRWKNPSEYKGFRMISISCISFITHIWKRRKSFCEPLLIQLKCMDPVGGGVWTPQPSENHKAIGFLGNRGGYPEIS